MTLAAGTSVTDKVRLVRRLGHGTMGDVWVAQHLTLKTEVAVKFVSGEMLAAQPDAFRRFSIEAAAAARIKSPHVVRTFDHGEMDDGIPYIVMELLDGQSLQDKLEADGPLTVADAYQVLRQVGKALDAAHAVNIIHRDVKPHNIFLSDQQGDMFVKLLDFGSAKVEDDTNESRLTSPGIVLGTPEYISRDLIQDAKSISWRVDLWALAVVVYKCLTGSVPFQGATIARTCRAIINGKMKRPSRVREDLGSDYDGWFTRVFNHDPGLRPQTGAEMAASFKKVAGADMRSTQPPPVPKQPRRTRMLTIGALAALGLLTGGFVATQFGGVGNEANESGATPSAVATASGNHAAASTSSAASSATSAALEASEAPRMIELGDGGGDSVGRPAAPNLIAALNKSRIIILAGAFWMGCADDAKDACADNERPGATVNLARYAIDRVEVSVGLYFRCVRAGACSSEKLTGHQRAGGPFVNSNKCNWTQPLRQNHPINCVDYAQAETFCRWVDARLPSEAEWEKAARGVDRRPFPWRGSKATCAFAVMGEGAEGCRAHGTWPTGSKRPGASPFGVLNTAGNVREWVADWYDAKYYASRPGDNPAGPEVGSLRVGRGGSWGNAVGKFLRTTVREGIAPTTRSMHLGFRCATTLSK